MSARKFVQNPQFIKETIQEVDKFDLIFQLEQLRTLPDPPANNQINLPITNAAPSNHCKINQQATFVPNIKKRRFNDFIP